ncbi:farnesol dehydrogenase-like [Orussus abietinus]|uniref:farnesol dehydrogenase-like n=1 Tax=Orussus abietinus TaxID=222816 RepID=UPI000626D550|nr:farnesol dehydrogenase-like [Orussus abietinus]
MRGAFAGILLANGRSSRRRMERWTGKVAVVTGASAGIGASIVRQLLDNGLVVVGLARRAEKIKDLARTPEEAKEKLHAVECDVTKEDQVVCAFSWVREHLGTVDVLVNNAGLAKETSLSDGDLEDWRAVFDVNVFGLCLCTREAVRAMRERNEGLVVNINSFAGERVPAIPGFGVYPASKRATTGLIQTLRHELLGTEIRITSISPGLVATELMAKYSTFSEEAMAATPVLLPQDVAAAISYVLSTPPHVLVQEITLRPVGETW